MIFTHDRTKQYAAASATLSNAIKRGKRTGICADNTHADAIYTDEGVTHMETPSAQNFVESASGRINSPQLRSPESKVSLFSSRLRCSLRRIVAINQMEELLSMVASGWEIVIERLPIRHPLATIDLEQKSSFTKTGPTDWPTSCREFGFLWLRER